MPCVCLNIHNPPIAGRSSRTNPHPPTYVCRDIRTMTGPMPEPRHQPASVDLRMQEHTRPAHRSVTPHPTQAPAFRRQQRTRHPGTSSDMLNRLSPAIRITYSERETAAIPPHIARAGNFPVMWDRNTLVNTTTSCMQNSENNASLKQAQDTGEQIRSWGTHSAPTAPTGQRS